MQHCPIVSRPSNLELESAIPCRRPVKMRTLHTALLLFCIFTIGRCQPMFDDRLVLGSPLEAVVGDDLLLVCTVTGFNAAELQLLEEDGVLVNDGRIATTDTNSTARTFTLSNTVIADDGRNFSCSVQENAGPGVVVSIFFLQTFEFQGGVENFVGETFSVEENTDASLPFILMANPSPAPVLARLSGGDLNAQRVSVEGGAVQFVGVSREDTGNYSLTFTNQADTRTLTFTLDVQFRPMFDIVGTNADCALTSTDNRFFCVVELGTNVTLDCQFMSAPEGTLDMVTIPENSTNVRVENASLIVFENVVEANFDEMYSCTASNMVLGETVSVTVYIQIGLQAPTEMTTTVATTTDGEEVAMTTDGAGKLSPVSCVSIFLLLIVTLIAMS